jgi:hypothetical protein
MAGFGIQLPFRHPAALVNTVWKPTSSVELFTLGLDGLVLRAVETLNHQAAGDSIKL